MTGAAEAAGLTTLVAAVQVGGRETACKAGQAEPQQQSQHSAAGMGGDGSGEDPVAPCERSH